ncbi:MAG: PadR family transcriptional regulator [Anaerolineales bacterium]|nr:PadR family transcriptional regulator [Anaerolineales bacterium]
MSLKYTLLGFLSCGPLTGYDLKKHIDNSTQFFWHAKLSQIYPALKKLAEEELVEATVIPQEGKPDKKIYLITEAGRATLMDWLVEPMDELPLTKDPALLKLFFSGALDKEMLLAQLHRQLALHRAQLAYYQQETAAYVEQVIAETGLTREGVLWELARQFGEEYERTYIRWLEEAIATVEPNL